MSCQHPIFSPFMACNFSTPLAEVATLEAKALKALANRLSRRGRSFVALPEAV